MNSVFPLRLRLQTVLSFNFFQKRKKKKKPPKPQTSHFYFFTAAITVILWCVSLREPRLQ